LLLLESLLWLLMVVGGVEAVMEVTLLLGHASHPSPHLRLHAAHTAGVLVQ